MPCKMMIHRHLSSDVSAGLKHFRLLQRAETTPRRLLGRMETHRLPTILMWRPGNWNVACRCPCPEDAQRLAQHLCDCLQLCIQAKLEKGNEREVIEEQLAGRADCKSRTILCSKTMAVAKLAMRVSKLVHKTMQTMPRGLPKSVYKPNVPKRLREAKTSRCGLTTGNTLRALFPVLSREVLLDILMTGS